MNSHNEPGIVDRFTTMEFSPNYGDHNLTLMRSTFQENAFKTNLTNHEIDWWGLGNSNSSLVYNNESGFNVNDTRLIEDEHNEVQLPIDMQFNDGHKLAVAGYSVLLIFSAIGNISVLATILRWRKRQGRLTPVNLLLLHLVTADLLVTFLMMPMEIAWKATVSWLAGDTLCRILSVTRIFGLYLSGFVLMCISLDRYYAVVHPLSITNSGMRCRKMLATAWLFSMLCSFPQAIIFHVETHPTFTWYQQCVTFNSFPTRDYELSYSFFGFAFLYGVPLATIIGCYARILWQLWRVNSQGRGEETQLRRSTMGGIRRAKSRTLKMTLVIVSTFLFCWTPYHVMCIWYWLNTPSASQVDQRIQKGLFMFACTNSCMNPLIYGFFHFRKRHQTSGVSNAAIGNEASLGLHSSSSTQAQPRSLVISMLSNTTAGTRSTAASAF